MGSQPHAILLGGSIVHVDDALPCCFAPRSVSVMLALLPRGDEFRMNLSSCGQLLLCVSVAIPFLLRRGGRRYAPQQGAYKCAVMEKTRTYAKWPFLMGLLVHPLGVGVLSETREPVCKVPIGLESECSEWPKQGENVPSRSLEAEKHR